MQLRYRSEAWTARLALREALSDAVRSALVRASMVWRAWTAKNAAGVFARQRVSETAKATRASHKRQRQRHCRYDEARTYTLKLGETQRIRGRVGSCTSA